jgi:hypothetical protein
MKGLTLRIITESEVRKAVIIAFCRMPARLLNQTGRGASASALASCKCLENFGFLEFGCRVLHRDQEVP